jgi:anti-sigma factor RsiW
MTYLDENTRKTLYAYLDGELSAVERAKFEQRLASDKTVAEALEQERIIRQGLQTQAKRHQAPASLQQFVALALAEAEAKTDSEPSPPKPSGLWSWLQQRQAIPNWVTLLISLLWVGLGLTLWLVIMTPNTTPPVEALASHSSFKRLAGKHKVFFEYQPVFDVVGEPDLIETWFTGRIPFQPSLKEPAQWKLQGARLGEFHHEGTIQLLYIYQNQALTLIMFPPEADDFPPSKAVEYQNHRFYLGDDGERQAVLWQEDDVGYALIGKVSSETLLQAASTFHNSP